MHRFFVHPDALKAQPVTLSGDQAHQVRRVLRLRLGERVILLDGQGWCYEAALIALSEADARFQLLRRWPAQGEPEVHITLYQAVLKGERFDWALQKGTEVGVSAFVPLVCERNVVDDLAAIEGRRERWQRIIREAAEQSGRGRLPVLGPAMLFTQAVTSPPAHRAGPMERKDASAPHPRAATQALRLIPWENERGARLRDVLRDCNLAPGTGIEILVGPEGGFTAQEIDLARRQGIRPITLGPRILRAETAGVVAAALILYEAGEI